MLRWSNPAYGFVLAVLLLAGAVVPTAALAGNTHSEGGPVLEAPGVPESDGAQAITYWAGDSSSRVSASVGATLSGHWLQDIGFNMSREWQVGDDHMTVIELETNANQTTHMGYYGVINKTLTSLDPDEFPTMTMRAIPSPVATPGEGYIDLAWSAAVEDVGSPQMANIAGYHIFRSTDGKTFAAVDDTLRTGLSYRDNNVEFGTTYYYALRLSYRGTPVYTGSKLSGNSNGASPLDVIPPDVPVLASEPAFTPGTTNTLTWSDESASGAIAYRAEAALDTAFTDIAASSDWITETSYGFTGLQDGQTYFYRVRARDEVLNESTMSIRATSTQDATAPASNLLELTAFHTSSTVALEWTATDATSGVSGVQLFVSKDGGEFAEYAGGPFTSSPIEFDASTLGGDGNYAFYTIATDAVGNAEGAPESADANTSIDTLAPNAPALAALPEFAPGTSLLLAWDAQAESGATEYRLQCSSSADFATLAHESDWQAETEYQMMDLADGAMMHYRVQSRDAAGNESGFSEIAAVTQDASAPATMAEALPTYTPTMTFDIAWSGDDATSGLAGVELYYSKDGAPFTMMPGGPFTTSPIAFDASLLGDGMFEFYTMGSDAVGNMEGAPASADAQTTIDTSAPGAPTLAALPEFTPGSQFTLNWSDEGASGAVEYRAEMSMAADFSSIDMATDWTDALTFDFTGLQDAGTYFFRVQARDAALNATGFSGMQSTTMDATAPASLAATPSQIDGWQYDIAWSADDATSGVQDVELWYSRNGSDFAMYPGGPYTSSPILFDAGLTGGDATYAFYTIARDNVGNSEAAPETPDATLITDTEAPNAPTLAAVSTYALTTTLALEWSDEAASGAAEYRAQASTAADFSSIDFQSDWITETSHTFDALVDGSTYFLRVRARDAVLNESSSASSQVTIDATAPTSEVAALDPTNGSTFDIAWSGADATSGIESVELFFSRDDAEFALYPGGPFTTSPIAFDAALTGGDGNYRFYTRAHDGAGNIESDPATPDAATLIDTQAPNAPTLAAMPAYALSTTLTLEWSDEAASGAAEYRAQASTAADFSSIDFQSDWMAATSHTFDALADGSTYFLRVLARDAVMNESTSASSQVTIDATAPTSMVAALDPTHSSTFDIAWSGTDATSGIESVELYFSRDDAEFALYPGGPFTTSPIAFDAALTGGDGAYRFYTRAHDGAGNIESEPAGPDAETLIDTVAPEIPTLAALPQFIAGTSAALAWSDEGADAYRVEAATDAEFADVVASSDWMALTQHTFTSLADGGTFFYRVQARDTAGNMSDWSATLSATQDATAPSSAVAALPAISNASPLSIAWSGFDIVSGVQNVDLYYSRDGGPFVLHPSSPFASSPIDFDPAAAGGDGVYAFFTRARDGAGNLEAAPAAPDASIRIDTSGPSMPVITAMPEFSAGTIVVVQWSNESASGAIEYNAELSEVADFSTIARTTAWIPSSSFVFNGLEDGKTYWFRSRARDAALNMSPYSEITTTTMDDLSPASRANALPSVTPAASVNVAWTASDATSGIADVDLYYALNGGAFTSYPGGPFATSPIHFDSDLTGGEGSYSFYTRARDRVGNREAAPNAPDASTILTTAAVSIVVLDEIPEFTAGTSRHVSWEAANGATQYLVQAAEDASFTSILGASGWIAAQSYTFNGLSDGHRYYYRVRGRNELGIMGDFSSIQMSTQDNTPPASQVAPIVNKSGQRNFDIVWSASDATSGVAGVQLMVAFEGGAFATYPGGPFTSSPIPFDASQLGGDGSYAFYTIATDRVGNVEAAPAQADAATIVDTQAPAIPTMAAEPNETRGFENSVAWDAVADASEYHAQCALDAMFLNVIATTGWIPETSYTFTNLEPGVTYYYRVRSRDAANNVSSYSQPVYSMQSLGRILAPGWNLVSFDVTPDDPRIDRVLRPIAGSFSIVRSYESGQFNSYLPTMPVEMNDLQTVDARNAYWIYMTRPDTLSVKGEALADNTPIPLRAGWELVSYLPDNEQSTDVGFGSIRESLILARGYDQGYQSYYPALGSLSNLETLRPGFGYWLYMGADDELIYGAMAAAKVETPSRATQQAVASKSGGAAVPTVMDLWSLEVTLDGTSAPAGCTVEAYDAANNLIGSAKLGQNGAMLLHIPGDVSITEADEGALPGEAITLRLKTANGTIDLDTQIVFEADAAKEMTIEASLASQLPKAYSLAQNHPNPFNPSTNIAYAIPAGVEASGTQVRLQIFDIRGRVVRTLVNSKQSAGRYAVQWDGRDDAGQQVGSGVYFYRLNTEQFTQTRKMMLVK